ncbi:MAG TPA: SHOCT domain-containing protein [Gaiellaceae bacterium]|nr:SHOCT domain-containing protein [Gaiellaceae bacterium]
MLGAIISVAATGFLIGALARLAIPGPDPMPLWLTILIGLGGAATGGSIAALLIQPGSTVDGGEYFWILLASVAAAAGLVAAYRRFVQGRPISGPEARRFPVRGVGIARLRRRLTAMGVPIDRLGDPRPTAASPRAAKLAELDELHERGEIEEGEYLERRRQLLREEP